ncbi:MAG TPA: isoprenylcysteine carboxylmethyltransferase family protein [Terriglobales bacterium]|nr:isoprenylcysteine carboxylmethyltransferase family protein [Terriglobales bacterium]
MMLEFAVALFFTFGWMVLFVFRTEDLGETLPALTPGERWVSYGMIAAISVNTALGCIVITNMQISAIGAFFGVLVYGLGIGLWFWGRTQICPIGTKRVPNAAPMRFRRDGAFGLVRHPLYCGMLIASAAPLMATGRLVLLVPYAACVAVMLMRMIQEERLLRQQLGGEYESYQREVSRIIPYIW